MTSLVVVRPILIHKESNCESVEQQSFVVAFSFNMVEELDKLEKILNYQFRDKSLLTRALTHKSTKNDLKLNYEVHLSFIKFYFLLKVLCILAFRIFWRFCIEMGNKPATVWCISQVFIGGFVDDAFCLNVQRFIWIRCCNAKTQQSMCAFLLLVYCWVTLYSMLNVNSIKVSLISNNFSTLSYQTNN